MAQAADERASAGRAAQVAAAQLGMQQQMEPQLRVADVVEKLDVVRAAPSIQRANRSTLRAR